MTGSEKLLRAIGEIDEVMIADAALPYSPFKRFKSSAPMIAASFIVCVAVVIALARFLPAFGPAGGSAPDMNGSMTGDASGENGGNSSQAPGDNSGSNGSGSPLKLIYYKSPNGIIIPIDTEGDTHRFTVKNYIDLPTAITVTKSFRSKTGEKRSATNRKGTTLNLKIFVEGVEVDNIPTAAGTYEVTIDFSEITKLGYTPYGNYFNFGGYEGVYEWTEK